MSQCRRNMRLHVMFELLLIYASICTSASRKYSPDVIELIDKLPTEYCPHTKYCQSNVTYNLLGENQTACCQACSCEEDCLDRGTCCPDIKRNTKPQTEFCRDPIVKRATQDSSTSLGDGYYVVTDCPATEKNGELVQKCAGNSQTRYEDFVWVSDRETNKIYNNKFCAECNGVQKYKEWYLTTDCPQMLDGDYSFTETKVVPARCRLSVAPPPKLDVAANRCTLSVISECNQTRNWKTFKEGLEEACLAFEQHFWDVNLFGIVIYRNVFCYLCNTDPGTTIKNVCKQKDLSTRDTGPVFTTILDSAFFNDPEEPSKHPCAINEVLDPFQETCRKLSCPIFNGPFYGSCRRIALDTHLLNFEIVYRLDPVWEMSTFLWNADTDPNLKKFGKGIYKEINRKLGLLDANCKTCYQNVGGSNKRLYVESMNQSFPEYFVFFGQFAANEYCEEEFIIQRLMVLHGTSLTVKLNNRQMITFAIHTDKRSLNKVGRQIFYIFSDNQPCNRRVSVIPLAEAKVCPTVTLTSDDYFALIDIAATAPQRANINALFGYTGAISPEISADWNTETHVCLENYKNALADISAAPVPKLLVKIWIMCVTTLYYVQM